MAKWANATVLDGGLTAVKTGATRMILIKAYTAGDSYATVVGNAVATVNPMASGDFVITGSAGAPRVCTVGAKSVVAAANSGAVPDLHIALTDGVSSVLLVTDEITDVSVSIGNTVNFPAWTYTIPQPV